MNPLIASMVGPRGAKQFARTTDRSLGDLDAAKRLLGGRRWSELPREDKLEIKRNTGWQLGPGGDWLYETGADPVFTPAFNERFSPWLAADKGFSAALKTLYDTVGSLKAEESAIANSWNERHPRNLYSSFLPHVYNPSYAPRGFAAELALSDYDSAVKFAARLREDGLVDTRDMEMYRSAKRFLDRPELSKAIAELSNAMKRAKETEFKPFVGRLSDMVDLSADPEFAIAYPDFKDIDVAIVDAKDPELMGSFSAKDNKITITKRNLQKHGLSGALRTALHELAHARQDKEGAAPGGDDMTYIVDDPPGRDLLRAYREKLTKMEDTLANGSWLAKQLLGGPETLRNRIDIYRRTLAFLDQERSRFDQIVSRADQAGDEGSRKYYLYRRLAGEVDARNTVTRHGLDREARSSTLLEDTEDVPRSDQIDARFGVVPGGTISKAATVLDEHPHILQQAAKGGEAPDLTGMSNFLATDKVPDTIFGIPVVSRREDYTEADIAFFKEHPEAGGYYDMGDEDTEPESQGAVGGGRGKRVIGYPESEYEYTREKNPTRIDPNDIKGTGVSFTDADRVHVPEERLGEYGKWLDRIAALDPTMKEQRLVPPDWRTNPEWKEFQRDYDYGAAFMAGVDVPTTKAPDGRYHLSDAGKLPTHPTFSKESYYARDPRWSGLAGEWTKEGNYVPGELESRRRLLRAPSDDLRDLWNRAVKSTGNLDGMARMFAAMAGESSLSQRGATAEQISNGHLARLIVHANETDRYNKNPANYRKRTVLGTTNSTSHVLSKYKWGTGPGANWFDSSKMEPRFDLINSDPVAAKTARSLIMNVARFLNGDLKGKDWLPSDAISYGDGPKGLMPDREEIKPEENRIGPMPRGFRIGRKKGTK